MAKRLARVVHVRDLTGRTVVLMPGDTVPKWAANQVTNPKAFEDGGEQQQAGNEPPPRSGRGSGVEAWRTWAEAHGVDTDDEMSRDDVIAACEQFGVVEPEQPRE